MRHITLKLGRFNTAILIGLLSIIFSMTITYIAISLFKIPRVPYVFIFSVGVPAIVAPVVSWFFLGVYFKQIEMEKQMIYLATHDSLTGLLNRRAFFEQAQHIFNNSEKLSTRLAILYLDIDNFKNINDTYGHSGGDTILSSFQSILVHQKNEKQVVSRFGGEEFVVLIEDANLNSIKKTISQIQNRISNHNQEINFTVSIGVFLFLPSANTDLDYAILKADKALYKAKSSGKDCVWQYIDGYYQMLTT